MGLFRMSCLGTWFQGAWCFELWFLLNGLCCGWFGPWSVERIVDSTSLLVVGRRFIPALANVSVRVRTVARFRVRTSPVRRMRVLIFVVGSTHRGEGSVSHNIAL